MIYEIIRQVSVFVIGTISSLGYAGVFVLMLLESANIPIPSEIIMPFSGFLAFQGHFNFWLVALIGALGNLAGSLISYFASSWLVKKRENSRLLSFLLPKRFLDKAEEWFSRYGSWSVFFSRLLPIVRTFISLPAGLGKMKLEKFSLLTACGSLIWSTFLAWIGFTLSENWASIEIYFRRFDIVILAALAVFLIYWLKKHFGGKMTEKHEEINRP